MMLELNPGRLDLNILSLMRTISISI